MQLAHGMFKAHMTALGHCGMHTTRVTYITIPLYPLMLLQAQDRMDWVIIRPGGLTNDPGTGNWFATENVDVCGAIAREDVAEIVCKALFSDKVNNKVISTLDADRVTSSVEFEVVDL